MVLAIDQREIKHRSYKFQVGHSMSLKNQSPWEPQVTKGKRWKCKNTGFLSTTRFKRKQNQWFFISTFPMRKPLEKLVKIMDVNPETYICQHGHAELVAYNFRGCKASLKLTYWFHITSVLVWICQRNRMDKINKILYLFSLFIICISIPHLQI
jgi:hypothetical protein